MAVLLLFEKSDSLSYEDLKETTKLTDDQFPRSDLLIFFQLSKTEIRFFIIKN